MHDHAPFCLRRLLIMTETLSLLIGVMANSTQTPVIKSHGSYLHSPRPDISFTDMGKMHRVVSVRTRTNITLMHNSKTTLLIQNNILQMTRITKKTKTWYHPAISWHSDRPRHVTPVQSAGL